MIKLLLFIQLWYALLFPKIQSVKIENHYSDDELLVYAESLLRNKKTVLVLDQNGEFKFSTDTIYDDCFEELGEIYWLLRNKEKMNSVFNKIVFENKKGELILFIVKSNCDFNKHFNYLLSLIDSLKENALKLDLYSNVLIRLAKENDKDKATLILSKINELKTKLITKSDKEDFYQNCFSCIVSFNLLRLNNYIESMLKEIELFGKDDLLLLRQICLVYIKLNNETKFQEYKNMVMEKATAQNDYKELFYFAKELFLCEKFDESKEFLSKGFDILEKETNTNEKLDEITILLEDSGPLGNCCIEKWLLGNQLVIKEIFENIYYEDTSSEYIDDASELEGTFDPILKYLIECGYQSEAKLIATKLAQTNNNPLFLDYYYHYLGINLIQYRDVSDICEKIGNTAMKIDLLIRMAKTDEYQSDSIIFEKIFNKIDELFTKKKMDTKHDYFVFGQIDEIRRSIGEMLLEKGLIEKAYKIENDIISKEKFAAWLLLTGKEKSALSIFKELVKNCIENKTGGLRYTLKSYLDAKIEKSFYIKAINDSNYLHNNLIN